LNLWHFQDPLTECICQMARVTSRDKFGNDICIVPPPTTPTPRPIPTMAPVITNSFNYLQINRKLRKLNIFYELTENFIQMKGYGFLSVFSTIKWKVLFKLYLLSNVHSLNVTNARWKMLLLPFWTWIVLKTPANVGESNFILI
jgi:hypothetical protein